jgi:hypothetical protein
MISSGFNFPAASSAWSVSLSVSFGKDTSVFYRVRRRVTYGRGRTLSATVLGTENERAALITPSLRATSMARLVRATSGFDSRSRDQGHMSEPQVTDPHGLLATGEPLATVPELALTLGCSGKALHSLLGGRLYGLVRFVRYKPGGTRYCVADVLTAVEPLKAEIEERRRCAEELEATDRAAKAARVAAAEAAQSARKAKQADRTRREPRREARAQAAARPAKTPEVIIGRRPPSK